jgi:hypothetical protein
MIRHYHLFASALALLLTTCVAQAATVVLTDAAAEALATGTTPAVPTFAEAKIGQGSWQANGMSKSSISFTLADLGLSPTTTITDISSMSFSTLKSTTGGSAPDWYLSVYTVPTGMPISDNGAVWYGVRMTWEGLYANNFDNTANQWNTFSTDPGTNQLTMIDSNTTNFGFYGAPTLQTLQANDGLIDWSTYPTSSSVATFDYNNSPILAFVLETGSGWANGFDGYLDEFTVTAGAISTTVDFERVPEPGSIALVGLAGLFGTAVYLRRRWA